MFLYKCRYTKVYQSSRGNSFQKENIMNFSVAPVNFAMVSQPSAPANVETAGSVAFSGAETAGSVASSSCGGASFSAVA